MISKRRITGILLFGGILELLATHALQIATDGPGRVEESRKYALSLT